MEFHGQENFLENVRWVEFVEHRIKKWEKGFDWLVSCPEDCEIQVVCYEDLVVDMVQEVKKMLKFLHYNVTSEQ